MSRHWTSAIPLTLAALFLVTTLIVVTAKAHAPNSGELILPEIKAMVATVS